MEFSFAWSVEYQQTEELKNIHSIKFSTNESGPFLESAAKMLRTCSESEETHIQGRIVQLQADGPLAVDDFDGNENTTESDSRIIVVDWELENGRHALIRIPLTHSQYRLACDAHRDEKIVSFHGMPEKRGRSFYLTSPKNFEILT